MIREKLRFVIRFLRFFKTRIREDRLPVNAGYLSYVTLLSIVPLVTVMLSAFSAFPVFESIRSEIENFIFRNFVPVAGEMIKEHVLRFVDNASKMTAVGIVVLVIVALTLISSVDRTLNQIWRTQRTRRAIVSFSIYWMILTLGPILIGTSLVLTSYLVSLTKHAGGSLTFVRTLTLRWFPYFSSVTAFFLLYMIVPDNRVKFKHAAVGALVAAVLFECCKKGFAFYIAHFPTNQAIYGALATIPVLFIWVYLSWIVVLFGAELAGCMGAFEVQTEESEEPSD